MSDYMKEAERLLDELRTCTLAEATHYASPDFKRAKASEEAANRARAALLAHIQRRGVPEGWKEATIAWEVCASIHREYAKKKDPFFTTRQADFVRRTEAARAALLTAAPDHFRDAPAEVALRRGMARDNDALDEARAEHACSMGVGCGTSGVCYAAANGQPELCQREQITSPAPAEVPKPVAYGFGNTAITGHTNRLMMVRLDVPFDDQYAGAYWLPLVLADEAHTYGVACRAAGEAAGYARGREEAGRDAERYSFLRGDGGPTSVRWPRWEVAHWTGDWNPVSGKELDAAIDAALRGEVK